AVACGATAPYGAHPDQVIDFWFPSGAAACATSGAAADGTADSTSGSSSGGPSGPGRPLLVTLFHGGFWRQRYDRRHLSPFAAWLAEEGCAVASVEYRRVGDGGAGGWPRTADDVAAAVAAVRGAAGAWWPAAGSARHVVAGHSAGGHLALWLAASGAPPAASVDAVVALAPVADLARAVELGTGDGAVSALLGGDPALLPRADPAGRAPTVDVTLIHGTADAVVPVELSRRFAAAAPGTTAPGATAPGGRASRPSAPDGPGAGPQPAAGGPRVDLITLDGVGHYGLIDPASPPARRVLRELTTARTTTRTTTHATTRTTRPEGPRHP
ncbi:alpha/beta hydrolase family protein, partial [Streptomyces sp. URMC 123]|uniref:alpha/beta hydrolase family protein n=1 Tax=Streptomyces sp. URMC 123 TaxID=3423403 RepID=UPI003F1B9797